METRLLAIGNKKPQSGGTAATVEEDDKGYRIRYTVSGPLYFGANAFARLLFVQGASRPCLVTCDFVAWQDVQGRAEQVLGITSLVPGPWVPLNSGIIDCLGTIGIRPVDDSSIKTRGKKSLFFLIQIASEDYVQKYGGTQGATRSRAETTHTEYDVSGGEQ